MVVLASTALSKEENRFTRLVYASSPSSFAINCGYSTTSVALTAWSFTPNAVYTIEFFEFLNKSPNSADYKTSSTTQQANNPTPGYLSAHSQLYQSLTCIWQLYSMVLIPRNIL
jgi:hypothetical protein